MRKFKRKMLMGVHMMMKRGKAWGRSLMNMGVLGSKNMNSHSRGDSDGGFGLLHHSRGDSDGGFGLQEYEFSSRDSPANPVAKRKYYLPTSILNCFCIRPHPVEDYKEEPLLDCDNGSCSKDCLEDTDMPSVQKLRPLSSPVFRRTLSLSGKGLSSPVFRRTLSLSGKGLSSPVFRRTLSLSGKGLSSPVFRRTLSLSGKGNNDHQVGEGNKGHEVDRQAEQYIAKVYELWSFEKNMSYRRYQEMLDRGIS